MDFILYSSDHSSVRWGEQVFFSSFSDKDTTAQGDEVTYPTSNK